MVGTTPYIPDLFAGVVANAEARIKQISERDGHVWHGKLRFNWGLYGQVSFDMSDDEWDGKDVLIWLVNNYTEDRSRTAGAYYCDLVCSLLIAVPSDVDMTMPSRATNVYKPTLIPVYEQLMQSMASVFLTDPAQAHKRIDRPYWGGGESHQVNTDNLFREVVDAIEIKDLRVKVDFNKNCNPTNNLI